MRAPAAPVWDVSVASPPESRGPVSSDGRQNQNQCRFAHNPPRRSLVRALGEAVVSGVCRPGTELAGNSAAMGSQAKLKQADEPQSHLVEEIARAMQHRPLMGRLAHVEAAYAEESLGSPAANEKVPAPAASARPSRAASEVGTPPTSASRNAALARIEKLVEDAEEAWTMPPSSAEWLGKAQRERNRARLRNVAAWLATLAIGGTIIATTALLLQP